MGPPKGLRAAELWWGCRSVQHRALTAVTEQPPLTASSALMRWPIAPGHRDGVWPGTKPSLQLEIIGGLFCQAQQGEQEPKGTGGDKWNRVPLGLAVLVAGSGGATARSRLLLQGRVWAPHCQSVLTAESHSNKPQKKHCWQPRVWKGPVADSSLASVLLQTPFPLLTHQWQWISGTIFHDRKSQACSGLLRTEQEFGAELLFGVLQDKMFSWSGCFF